MSKKSLIFNMLAITLLVGCGGSSAPTADPDSSTAFAAPGTDTPTVTPDVTTVGNCGTLPGQWKFNDIVTGEASSFQAPLPSAFKSAFQKSWGGTTTAYTVWELEGDEPVWNEGRTIHVGTTLSFTLKGMVRSITLTGAPANMTAFIGTDNGLEIVDLIKNNDKKWEISKQTSIEAMGAVHSVAIAMQPIMEKNGHYVPTIFMVANDAVLLAKVDDLRAGYGCMSVAYQAKDHPVDPNDATNKRTFRPIKVVAQHSFAAFLTATRLSEQFANTTQLKEVLQKEWTSFQATAYLIDITRQSPVSPLITTMGSADRFFASDIAMSDTSVYLLGTKYSSAKPETVESGIAVYKQLVGNPVVNSWAGIPAKLGGNFRLAKFDTNLANAYIRGLDMAAKVEDFLSGATQQKWTGWPNALDFDYVRSVTFRLAKENNKKDETKPDEWNELAVTIPQFPPSGPLTMNWNQLEIYGPKYAATTTLINATSTDVDYLDSQGSVVHQHLQDDGIASFPIFETNDTSATANTPRIFHAGNLIFYVRHGVNGAVVRVFQDTLADNKNKIDISSTGPALLGFIMSSKASDTANSPFNVKNIAAFGNMNGLPEQWRVDDIREVSNPNLPTLRHFAALVHSWDGKTNSYRLLILQMNIAPAKMLNRSIEIQGCSDGFDPANNYSGNTSYGKPDEQPRFMTPLTVTAAPKGSVTYQGYFQHFSNTNNIWAVNITTDSNVVPGKNTCVSSGELIPQTNPVSAESLGATFNGATPLGLMSNGLVKWVIDAKTTQYLDVGSNYLGSAVSLESGKIVPAGNQFITQMDAVDGFHPTVIFPLNSIGGESCPVCQFTDIASDGPLVFTANPERGIELYKF